MEEGEIIVTIEHCTNCHLHQSNTRHVQEKYTLFAKKLKQAIMLRYPMIKVFSKPIVNTPEDSQKGIKVPKKGEMNALSIDHYRPQMRIGAFEVFITHTHTHTHTHIYIYIYI